MKRIEVDMRVEDKDVTEAVRAIKEIVNKFSKHSSIKVGDYRKVRS